MKREKADRRLQKEFFVEHIYRKKEFVEVRRKDAGAEKGICDYTSS